MAKYRNWGIAVAFFALLAFVVRGDFVITGGQLSSFGSGSASSSSLNTSLVSYWKLDESSGTRYDSEPTGTPQDLTDNSTVDYTSSGLINNAAYFVSTNLEVLTISDSSDLSTGDIDFSIAAWVKLKSLSASGERHIFNKYYGASGRREYALFMTVNERLAFRVSATGSSGVEITDSTFGALTTNTWYFVVAWHDSVNNQIAISINNQTPQTLAHTTGVYNGTQRVGIGMYEGDPYAWDGYIDEVGFWKKALTSNEISELYNSGSGKTCCPF
ncbi:MAG: LamG domain-containing protein [Hyphomicrobiaceae bacterium]|nr:MAG: LamG domain-containing protein [Hyphomicrobiaceae bacterium]